MELVLLLASFAASLIGVVLTFRRRRAPGATPLLLLLLAVAEWQITSVMIALQSTVADKRWWGAAQYAGVASVATLWLHFVLRYIGDPRARDRRVVLATAVIPIATFALAVTSTHHALLWTRIELVPAPGGPHTIWHHGPLFWVFAGYNYLILAAATALLLRAFRARAAPIVMQQRVLIFAGIVPWIANVLYLAGLGARGLDPTPFAFGITALCAVFALADHGLLQLSPAKLWRS